MENKKVIYVASMIIVICLASIFAATFSYIGKPTTSNNVNTNVTIVANDVVTFQYTGTTTLNLTAALSNLAVANASNSYTSYSVSELTNRTVSMTSNATVFPNGLTCSYDIIYTPTVAYTQTPAATSAGLRELVLRGKIGNTVYFETNVAGSSPVLLYSHSISTTASSATATQEWGFSVRFYNLNIDQEQATGQTPSGVVSIQNVKCSSPNLVDYLIRTAPHSGTDAVSSSPWILTSDHTGEWRYAGKNPDNYIQFNGELWRIIGVMPNMTYCTGKYGYDNECSTTSTGSLVKIIRNLPLGGFLWDYKQTGVGSSTTTSGSNDWSDSQLMLMLNGTRYLTTAYDSSNNKLHTSYKVSTNGILDNNAQNFYNATYSYLDGSGTTVYKPSSATTSGYTATSGTVSKKITSSALSKIATVKWDLYGTNSYTTSAEGSPSAFYNKERNINSTGLLYTSASLPENRPAYWYGKIGLMYPSDYGYATNGGSTYNRRACLGFHIYGWSSGDYKTDCATNSYLWYNSITSIVPTSGADQWTMTPLSGSASDVSRISYTGGVLPNSASNGYAVRPVLYLKADTGLSSGTGTYSNPYTIS